MKLAKWTLMLFIMILAASAAWAQCPVQCPAPCPVVQQPCPQECPQACPCPAAVPSAIGAGPAADLQCLECPNFDPAYASKMFAQNSVIIAVTQYGMQRVSNDNLRDISGEINGYLSSANSKLQGWYGVAACGAQVTPDCDRAQAIIAELSSQPASCFDAVYATTLSQLIKQSNAADTIAGSRAVTSDMQKQAQFLSAKESDWSMRLDRWVSDHS